jgi:hypothetical protein
MTGEQIGILIGVIAGAGWALAGAAALEGQARAFAVFGALGLSVLLGVATADLPSAAMSGRFDGGIYGVAVTAETIAILGAVALLRRWARQDWLPPVIAVIVGLHFLGLWRATGSLVFVALAAGLCVVGIAGSLVPASRRLLVVGFGCAAALWAAAAVTVGSALR